jgi:hypothetical protein
MEEGERRGEGEEPPQDRQSWHTEGERTRTEGRRGHIGCHFSQQRDSTILHSSAVNKLLRMFLFVWKLTDQKHRSDLRENNSIYCCPKVTPGDSYSKWNKVTSKM